MRLIRNAISLGSQDDNTLLHLSGTTTLRPKNPYFPNDNSDSSYDPWKDEVPWEDATQECKLIKYLESSYSFIQLF